MRILSGIQASGILHLGRYFGAVKQYIDLQQDGTRYFDLHHTPDDTLDKIDKVQLRQNVAVWTTVVAILANEEHSIQTGEPINRVADRR